MSDTNSHAVPDAQGVEAILAGFRALGIAASVYQTAVGQEAARHPQPINVTLSHLIEALKTINITVVSPIEQIQNEELERDRQQHQTSQDELGDFMDALSISSISSSTAETEEVHNFPTRTDIDDAAVIVAPQEASSSVDAGSANAITGFVCVQCNAHNLVRPSTDTWYTVIAGRRPGVYKDWAVVHPLVTRVSEACFKKHKSEAEAREVFARATASGITRVLP